MIGVRRREGLVSARKTVGLSQEKLAEIMDVDRRTVIRWEAGDFAPLPFQRPKLARVLGRSQEELRVLLEGSPAADLPHELEPAFSWLDRRVGWSPGTTRERVGARVSPDGRRGPRVDRSHAADALASYYGELPVGYALYQARYGKQGVRTSILSRSEWLDLSCQLTPENDQLLLRPGLGGHSCGINEKAAVGRLAEAAEGGVRLADVPIYRLTELDVGGGALSGSLDVVPFVEYALTLDLLEREMFETLAAKKALRPGHVPLRDKYLPDLATVLDLAGRLCAGGVLALTAIARPADPYRGGRDYLLLIQERSRNVLNATGSLAVIPKAFHRPSTDQRADARIGATLRRALENELFGRSTSTTPRAVSEQLIRCTRTGCPRR